MTWTELAIDRGMYDHPGRKTTVVDAIRRYRDRPALAAGQEVTIVRFATQSDATGTVTARLLVRTNEGAERWVDAVSVAPVPDENLPVAYLERRDAALTRMSKGTSEILARRD